MRGKTVNRRQFARCCAASALLPGLGVWAQVVEHPPAQLVDAEGAPLRATEVPADEALIFAYPYAGVPCYLVRLAAPAAVPRPLHSPDEGEYTPPAGVGPDGTLVAFVAICTHQLSYPTPAVSSLRYAAHGSALAGPQARIVCCAHGSVFDPAAGGERVSGPAPGPLLPVRLQYDAGADTLSATGTVADKLLARFFAAYKGDLIERYGPGAYREPVGETTPVQRLSQYTRQMTSC